MANQVNAATELAREHAELDRLTARIGELDPGTERTALVREVAGLFAAHVEAEERFLYPELRRFLIRGWKEAADQARRQRAVTRTVRAIDRLPRPAGDDYDILVGHLVVGIQDHVERQDAVLLPALIDACPIEDINRLGRQLSEGVEAALAAARRESRRAPAHGGRDDPGEWGDRERGGRDDPGEWGDRERGGQDDPGERGGRARGPARGRGRGLRGLFRRRRDPSD